MKQLRVCVIGAGPSGLAAARHLTNEPDTFDVSVFERGHCIGGLWVYNEETGMDKNGLPVHSSLYRNLRTNLPKEVMAFPDFPFPSEWPSYISHQKVLEYLEDYASQFKLQKYVNFNSLVSRVRPLVSQETADKEVWEVLIRNLDTNQTQVDHFDAVIVCNGHNSVPRMPVIPGLESFPGLVMHSHEYRYPELFQGMRVVILGAGNSGLDICLHVAKCAQNVYLSHRSLLQSNLPENVEQRRCIISVSSDGTVLFGGGEEEKAVDAIMFCTGYNVSLPFLDDACGIRIRSNRVTHLYKHVFNTKHPTLSFIGLSGKFCVFPHFGLQAQYIAAVLSQRKQLPSEEEMNADEERDFQERLSLGMKEHHAHWLLDFKGGNWCYGKTIARLAGVNALSPYYNDLCSHVINRRQHFVMEYKNEEFQITSDEMWTTVQ